jgi:hypothetical protein
VKPALAGIACALLALAAGPARAELRVTEAVGAVPLHTEKKPSLPPRDAAERKAMNEAVRRVALQLLSAQDTAALEPKLGAALGSDPKVYISSFRTLEDRGERPALFSDDPDAKTEYVVVVEARVDADRVRDALARGGLPVTSAGDARRYRVRVEATGLADFASYRALRETLLEGVGVRSALPVEIEQGRAVLDVDSQLAGQALLDALVRSAPPGLAISPLEMEESRLRVRVEYTPEPTPAAAPPAAAPPPRRVDTRNPNR